MNQNFIGICFHWAFPVLSTLSFLFISLVCQSNQQVAFASGVLRSFCFSGFLSWFHSVFSFSFIANLGCSDILLALVFFLFILCFQIRSYVVEIAFALLQQKYCCDRPPF